MCSLYNRPYLISVCFKSVSEIKLCCIFWASRASSVPWCPLSKVTWKETIPIPIVNRCLFCHEGLFPTYLRYCSRQVSFQKCHHHSYHFQSSLVTKYYTHLDWLVGCTETTWIVTFPGMYARQGRGNYKDWWIFPYWITHPTEKDFSTYKLNRPNVQF